MQRKYPRSIAPLMSLGLFYRCIYYVSGPGNISVVLLSMEGQRALGIIKNILISVLKMNEGLTYGSGTT